MLQQTETQQKAMVEADKKLKAKTAKTKQESKRDFDEYIKTIKFYYLPIIIIGIFFAIIILGVYPTLSSLLDNIEELDTQKIEAEKKDEKIEELKKLQSGYDTTSTYLASINKIAPVEQTSVVNFQTGIKSIATQNSLVVTSAVSGEEIIANEESNAKYLQLIEVPTNFELEGTFNNLRNFLVDIYKGEDFIIIQEMEFVKEVDSDKWNMDIEFVKYQFAESEVETPVALEYTKVSETVRPNKTVLEFLDEKYINQE